MFFSRFEYHMFYVLYPFVTYLLTLPRISLYLSTCLSLCISNFLSIYPSFYPSAHPSVLTYFYVSVYLPNSYIAVVQFITPYSPLGAYQLLY
jgi:hypothetical protein